MLVLKVSLLGLLVSNILFLVNVVPTNVVLEVDIAIGADLLPELAALVSVLRHRCANVEVVTHLEALVERLELSRVLVGDSLGGHVVLDGTLLDLLAMFVGTGQKEHITAKRAVVSRDNVTGDTFVSVAHVRVTVRVVDRSGQEELLCTNLFARRLRAQGSNKVTVELGGVILLLLVVALELALACTRSLLHGFVLFLRLLLLLGLFLLLRLLLRLGLFLARLGC
mmetsp:Transcript_996/g.2391  ORF Transcript_996/g.2391 Transcript_996/m.2391 type:complete len:225 (+) Transcript_996:1949-2623(+)